MVTVEKLLKQPYARVLTPDENGGYTADVLEIPDCFSEGETADEAMENLEDAMRGWFEVAIEQGKAIPEPLDVAEYNGKILLRAPKWVHRECVRRAEFDGVSLNQWLVEAIAERLGAENMMDRLASKLSSLGSLSIAMQRRQTTTETTHIVITGQRELGTTSQLVEPDGEHYLNWTEVGIKERANA